MPSLFISTVGNAFMHSVCVAVGGMEIVGEGFHLLPFVFRP